MVIQKEKLPKGLSYPLKTSFLDAALKEHDISISSHLIQRINGGLFECFFWPPNPNVTYERLYIRASAVPSEKAQATRIFIESLVVPEFISWLKTILSLELNSTIRREEQYFRRNLE